MTAEPKESPSTPVVVAKKLGKMMAVRVQMLDDSITLFQVQVRFEQKVSHKKYNLHHRFLTWGPWTPKRSVKRV